jgi:hypothetical protein
MLVSRGQPHPEALRLWRLLLDRRTLARCTYQA